MRSHSFNWRLLPTSWRVAPIFTSLLVAICGRYSLNTIRRTMYGLTQVACLFRRIFARLILLLVFTCALAACSGPSYKADRTPSEDAAKALPAEAGVVIDVQAVVIEYDAQTAQAVGAGVGGVIANQATKDSHSAVRTAATAAGAAGGAMAGDVIAEQALSPPAEEVVIELDTGEIVSVTQESGAEILARGDLVWLVRGSERTRVFKRTE